MLQSLSIEALTVEVYATAADLDVAAADHVIQTLQAITVHRPATVVFATGSTPLGLLKQLRDRQTEVDWNQVVGLHLDEYLGIEANHPASFQRYLREQVAVLPLQAFHYLNSQALEPVAECDRYTALLNAHPPDLCLLGVGNNGHLAFNDPSVANVADPRQVKLVQLDAQNRQQQFQSGHFSQLEQVPRYAYTLTLPAILASRQRLCLAKGKHKAAIVQRMLQDSVELDCPASYLRTRVGSRLLLDAAAAAKL
ncbi:MAG: 6-phosphogluconolactonase [Cyanobacteria bacterium P01_A01_bin.105]